MLLIALPQRLLMINLRGQNRNVLSLIRFAPLDQIPKIKYAIWLRVNILR